MWLWWVKLPQVNFCQLLPCLVTPLQLSPVYSKIFIFVCKFMKGFSKPASVTALWKNSVHFLSDLSCCNKWHCTSGYYLFGQFKIYPADLVYSRQDLGYMFYISAQDVSVRVSILHCVHYNIIYMSFYEIDIGQWLHEGCTIVMVWVWVVGPWVMKIILRVACFCFHFHLSCLHFHFCCYHFYFSDFVSWGCWSLGDEFDL